MNKPHELVINSYIDKRSFVPEGETESIEYERLVMILDVNGEPVDVEFRVDKYAKLSFLVASSPDKSDIADDYRPNAAT